MALRINGIFGVILVLVLVAIFIIFTVNFVYLVKGSGYMGGSNFALNTETIITLIFTFVAGGSAALLVSE